MFLLRSAFWLGLAFMLIQPAGMALTADNTGELTKRAVSAGQQALAQRIAETRCETIECLGGKAAIAAVVASAAQPAAVPAQAVPEPVPFPHPRLDRQG